jgi:hypothetical protein
MAVAVNDHGANNSGSRPTVVLRALMSGRASLKVKGFDIAILPLAKCKAPNFTDGSPSTRAFRHGNMHP